MALDRQVHVYSVDTRAFYTEEEQVLDREITRLKALRRLLKDAHAAFSGFYQNPSPAAGTARRLEALARELGGFPSRQEAEALEERAGALTPQISARKEEMRALLNRFDGVRQFRPEFLNVKNVVSVFESALTRTLELETGKLTLDLLVVKTCYFKVLRDLIVKGFLLNGERYVVYTASAGQIRTKRVVFLREARLSACRDTLLCGLTQERIRNRGGININKYLAYLALSNSATDPFPDFDVDRAIVVEDFSTAVRGLVDFIDPGTYRIRRQEMDVPIPHTDGCGMILPSVSRKNMMFRAPWVKGLLAVFPFDKFIREANRAEPRVNHGLVQDIYGKTYDILRDGIQYIFTRSQFKMWNYYDSWEEYKLLYRRHGCAAGVCNVEPGQIEDAKLNYQMLQTLSDLSDRELDILCAPTRETLKNLTSDRDTMLKVFGATRQNPRRNAFQEALLLYPELLQDEYTRETLRCIRRKLETEGRAGKLEIRGKYTFLVPDLYAFCQFLFLGQERPRGLLENGQVSCRLFPGGRKLDCLRSPHLYREHAVRENRAGLDPELRRWFLTDGLYTSCHDLISKVLQFDNDGDKSLVVEDETFVAAAERNLRGIVPLYYEMKKADAQPLTREAVYDCMIAAYTGGNIGQISNDITKLWNTGEEPDLDTIKLLCMENNFVIDYAKTLYKPQRPEFLRQALRQKAGGKVPHFFLDAKGKEPSQVAPPNGSCCNRLRSFLPTYRLRFDQKALGRFDWRMLTSSPLVPENELSQKIVEEYERCVKELGFSLSPRFSPEDKTNQDYLYQQVIDNLLKIYPNKFDIVDVLVRHLFARTHTRRKVVFWNCFGDVAVENLHRNLDQGSAMCRCCGRRFHRESNRQELCASCFQERRRAQDRERKKRTRGAVRSLKNA